CQQDYNAPYSF
nr:immunoglobulin light chain junction region [Macaca mulatta]